MLKCPLERDTEAGGESKRSDVDKQAHKLHRQRMKQLVEVCTLASVLVCGCVCIKRLIDKEN